MQEVGIRLGERMEAAAIVGLSITVILVSALVMERFRLPMVLGVLLAGSMIGPSSPIKAITIGDYNLGAFVIEDPMLVEVFALIGLALILFNIGLEFSIVRISELGIATFLAAIIKVGMMYLAGYGMGSLLGFSHPAAVLLGFLVSFSSTPIIIKILEGNGKLRRPEVPFIIAVLIIEDLLAVFLLGIMATSGISDPNTMALAMFKMVVTFVFAYILLSKALSWLLSFVFHSDELLVLFVVSLVLMIGYFTQAIGLEFSVGAFLAGSTLAGTAASGRIEGIIRPFNSVFTSFFFFSIGMMVDFGATFSSLPVLFGLLFVATIFKFAASAAAAYLSGFTGRSAAFAAAALLPMSELSLVIGASAAAAGIVPAQLVGMLAFVVVFSSLISVFAIGSEGKVYELAEGALPNALTRQLRFARSTSIGVQRVVQENSKYSHVIDRLPSIHTDGWPMSSHEQLTNSLRNVAGFGIGAVILFLMEKLLAVPPFAGALSEFAPFVTIGFFALSALFLSNSSGAFENYVSIIRRSGKTSLTMAMNSVAIIYFVGAGALLLVAAITSANAIYLILLVPCAAFSGIFALDIMKEGKLATRRWR